MLSCFSSSEMEEAQPQAFDVGLGSLDFVLLSAFTFNRRLFPGTDWHCQCAPAPGDSMLVVRTCMCFPILRGLLLTNLLSRFAAHNICHTLDYLYTVSFSCIFIYIFCK